GGDPLRLSYPGPYEELNRGKEILTWDARSEAPPEALAGADVVLEGFRPGVWERLGVELPATTVLCSITGFGPGTRRAGHDLNYMGYAGALADTAAGVPAGAD